MNTDEAEALLREDPSHFTRAVTDLGERQPLLTTQAIFNEQGVKVVEKGVAVNRGMYERLMSHRLSVPLQDTVAAGFSVDADHLRETAELQLLQVPLLARAVHEARPRAQLLDTLARVPLPTPMAFQLTLASELRQESYEAAVRSALLTAWLSISPTTLRFDVGMAAAAGLLHDVGMLHLDPVLLHPAPGLSGAQQRQLHSHPLVSTVLLQRHHEYAKDVVRAVGEHHEQLNGGGYPRRLNGEQISPMGRALALAEVAAALLAPELPAGELRLSVVLRMNAHRFDPHMSARLMALLRPQADEAAAHSLLVADPVARLCAVDDALAGWSQYVPEAGALPAEQAQELSAVGEQVAQLRRTLANVGAAREQLAHLGNVGGVAAAPPAPGPDAAAAPAAGAGVAGAVATDAMRSGADAAVDASLHLELSLLAREAGWQLRAITRQARRRWREGTQEAQAMLPALRDWLAQAEAALVPTPAPESTLPAAAVA